VDFASVVLSGVVEQEDAEITLEVHLVSDV
jgi:hypothetical protein